MTVNRRMVLGSFLAAGALWGGRAQAAESNGGGQAAPAQPNNAHAEPGNAAAPAPQPVHETLADKQYRPNIHFSPPTGFMNDPNGLIFDGRYFHLYYQYNPFGPYAGHVHWGHAVSTDLYTWQDLPIAIRETEAGEAYSGCAVLDRDNRSGLFPPRTQDKPQPGSVETAAQKAAQLFPSLPEDEQDRRSVNKQAQDLLDKTKTNTDLLRQLSDNPVSRDMSPVPMAPALPPMAGGLVAIYTRATPQRQTQYIAWSPDGGQTLKDYEGNPVLDIGHNSFRDPKVIWHAPTEKWVMVVVRSREHKVSFYGSFDLKHWMHLSDFGPSGITGVDYECPALAEVEVEGEAPGEKRWVLFVSINPGGPQGGSITQYFVGQFDGERFTPDDTIVDLTDFGKDSYALQTYENMPGNQTVYIAWLDNWQYCEELPNKSWRGIMTIPRKVVLRRDTAGWLRIAQNPYGLEALRQPAIPFALSRLEPQSSRQLSLPTGDAVELLLDVSLEDRASNLPDGDQGRAGRFVVAFSNRQGESLSIGFDGFSCQLWLDRSNLHGFTHPFFTGTFSSALIPGSRRFKLRIVLDACTLEVFANEGMSVGTALIYPASPLETLSFQVTNAAAVIHKVALYPLRKTMDRMEQG
ncbi:glycoside hydrolase family 32 protein [Bombella favorum]|uniref:Levanase n=1 Tax=Bombella favorum TaxID=2039164 RepID=A0ABR5ZP93_9PROT|nr:glycoside hydrolase family 32 protein [Bombella favorum]MBA5726166.1 levanase [Bombella favorum]